MSKTNKGFTLIEVLIALFIFTIISVIMVDALHSVLSSQAATEKNAKRLADLQMTMVIVSRDLQQVINKPITNYAGKLEPPLIGTPTSLVFTHAGFPNPLGQLSRSTLQRTLYQFRNHAFERGSYEVLDQAPDSTANFRTLFSPVSEITFTYLDEKGNFQKNWPPNSAASTQKPTALPRAVGVSLTIPGWGEITQLFILSAREPSTSA